MSPKKSSRTGLEAGRKQIDDAAPDRVLAGLPDGVAAGVPVAVEERDQPVGRNPSALPEPQHAAAERRARRHALEESVHRRQDDARLARLRVGEPRQHVDPAAHDLAVGRDAVVGKAVPGGEAQRLEPGMEELERRGEPGHAPVVAADMEERPSLALEDEAADEMGVVPFRGAGDERAPGLLQIYQGTIRCERSLAMSEGSTSDGGSA